MPLGLQRFFLRLLKYDYVLQFVPGKDLLQADMLPRISPRKADETSGLTEDVEIHAVAMGSDMVRQKTFNHMVDATANDPDPQKAIAYFGETVTLAAV